MIADTPVTSTSGIEHDAAGIWIRALAAIFDDLVASVVAVIVAIPVAAGVAYGTGEFEGWRVGAIYGGVAGFVAYLGIATAYGGGKGMRAAGLRVVKYRDGSRPGWRVAFVRVLVSIVGYYALGIGYVWALFEPQKRTLHDVLAGTIVVYYD